jgi:hypothetical protein
MQSILTECPFKGTGKLSKLFRRILQGLNLPAGTDTLQNKVLWGIRPCRTKACGVSDQQIKVLQGIRPSRTSFEYLQENETEFENILGCDLGTHMELNNEKNQRSKISCY